MSHVRRIITLLLLAGGTGASTVVAQPGPEEGPVVLITGSNRGIGFEFAQQYAQAGWTVLATARNPDGAGELQDLARRFPKVRIERLDVTDPSEIQALADKYGEWSVDVLLNNAGVLGSGAGQTINQLDSDEFHRVMAVNALGPLQVTEAFLDHVARSDQRKVVTITSLSGSLGLAAPGGGAYQPGFVYYRASKAAVNMGMLALHALATERNVLVGLYSPPFTESDMAQEVRVAVGRDMQAEPVDQVVAALITRIRELTPENSGVFMMHDGTPIPW